MRNAPLQGGRLAKIAPTGTNLKDPHAGEIRTHHHRTTTFKIPCQEVENVRVRDYAPGGGVPRTRKGILVRIFDADQKGWTPTTGDQLLAFLDKREREVDTTIMYVMNPRRTGQGIIRDAYWLMELETDAPQRKVE